MLRIGSISSGKRRPTRTARCPHQGFRPLFRKARARCAARGDAKRASRRSIGVVHTYSLPRSGKLGAGFGANGAIGRKKAVNYAGVAIPPHRPSQSRPSDRPSSLSASSAYDGGISPYRRW
ncbi:hypothetical protein XcvCFBP7112P_04290 [Xanthomonas citri pv. vignicola]|nr:hypothetical protein XcvCFBP7112P_04290 [Xanthomonas citri pv. vignicola]